MADRDRKEQLYDEIARMGKALASGKRLELLDVLSQGERSVDALARAVGMTITNTSAHLQVLARGGLVDSRREGARVRYRLASDDATALVIAMRDLARRRLGAVEQAAQAYLEKTDGADALTRDQLLERLKRGAVALVDVRPAEEYAAGHIPGAVSIPLAEIEERLAELPPDVEIVAYCRGPLCVYSPQAVRLLRRRGRAARQLEDGFPEWRLAGLPVEAADSR
ncbi:MAG TPA: metalloregulator ArsR/SmtB family transcription factor [Egibacteraceae bacterium]|nr:metalloregulator ArsR/SmtB family transcription factor [Egibacteraceae bacterium]